MKKIYCLPILFFLLCSCTAPRVVTRIIPEAPEGHFAMGREYISLESDQIEVELGYDGIQGEYLIFDFVIHNATSDTLSILPGDFYYLVLDSAHAEAAPHTPWMAMHPDKVLMTYDNSLEERKKDKGMNTFLGILQASVDILYYASGFAATENPGFIVDGVFQMAGTADQYISQDKMISSDMTLISEEKEVVNEEIFRTCQIPPGKVSSGYVYFPLHENTAYYMFCFPVENQLFQFVYKQQKELMY
ncbi:MAG: hypothetical protein U9R49_01415 [Bacteroidota bacterium]|nr:hypothetical protein [Bacteroidota bacterium]